MFAVYKEGKDIKMKKLLSIFVMMLAFFTFSGSAIPESASGEVTEIATYEDLLKIKDDPAGNYKLIYDIDCSGETWTPIDLFTGTFDGNGHALMNLTVKEVGSTVRNTIDGNWKDYDTYFAGLFCAMENATVKDLLLLGVNVDVSLDDNVYIGTVAGYMADSRIENCIIEGTAKIVSNGKSFGVGGILGYGDGVIDSCNVDVTLICIDTDIEWKDEQFMGGVYANGYPSVTNNTVNIKGYDSDHGYVHDGGIGGMFILPHGVEHMSSIDDNSVMGFINFFEDNRNRRAYCVGDIGEIMNWSLTKDRNDITGFERREIFEYDKDLYPCMCESPEYETTVSDPAEGVYGYTTNICKGCGYSYRSDFKSIDVYVEPEPEPEPEPVISEQETQTGESEAQPEVTGPEKTQSDILSAVMVPVICVLVLVLLIIMVCAVRNSKRRR